MAPTNATRGSSPAASTDLSAAIGRRLALALDRAGMTPTALAARMKDRGEPTSATTLYKIRGGRAGRVEVETVRRMSAVLGCAAGWLAFGEGEPPPPRTAPAGPRRRAAVASP